MRFFLSLALFTRARLSMSVTPSVYGTGSNERPSISSNVRHAGHWQWLDEPCERVFALLKNLFGDQQASALGDYLQSVLKLNYNGRNVG